MKILLLLTFVLSSILLAGQTPEAFNYQFVARDSTGQLLSEFVLEVKMSILADAPSGEVVYVETHQTITNKFGLVNLQIGTGEVQSGIFREIPWGSKQFFIKTEITIDKSSGFQLLGTAQLLSVPYALHAKSSDLKNLPVLNQHQIDTLVAVAGTVVFNASTNCLNYFTGIAWMAMCGECSPQPSQADAGEDQSVVGNQTLLSATLPQTGSGLWEIISGTGGIITDNQDPNSAFSGYQPQEYILNWTVSNVCGSNSDEVNIHFINEPPPPSDDLIFAPYVDCLLWPNFEIDDVTTTGICIYTCAFIVDNQSLPGANPCWGGYSTLGTDYYQDKIASLRSQGGDIIMSFGGANGIELAYAAADEFELKDALKTVIDAYTLTSIDFDIEGFMAADPPSIQRRSKAMKLLQNEYPGLQISLTLPVMPTGLTNDGINVVTSAIANNVSVSCVNIMAMDYGPSGIDMGEAAISAAEALFGQLKTIYTNAGQNLPDSAIWQKIGITPMIGENDVQGEIFSLEDADEVAAWAVEKGIGRLSMWSANRDRTCTNPNDPLYSCSRIEQDLFEFSSIFGAVSTYSCTNNSKK